ncbi:MAG TPA: hypothetical protein ENJ20_04180, partial [Bacteroidetes bacterium]|nr:hypothetical protein [Bacteroidota bacterium]
ARINGIYERELSVTMVMVPNTDQLIFLNANTDPYTNNSGSTMLEENQVTCDDIIGNANYHIGHVFSTGGGGIAYLQATCNPDIKAGGVTGLSNPTGDPFYVDYVAHEMGHQFGGNHTQNNDCNRNGTTAMEPGSASTIMGYAGVCSPNVQNHSDDYFHAVNLAEMGNHIAGIGGNCAALMPNGNNAPGVSVPATSYNVPVQTPFVLTATGSDPDTANMLTYCWEQMDNEVATMPPTPNNTVGPAFRSLQPTTQPARYFPNLNTILSNGTDMWEVLPAVARQMDFRCTVRDNNPGGGCTDEADLSLNFVDTAGPFLVTQPNTAAAMWMALQMETVTWDVANTDAAPVNADSVDIFLSVDGGLTYPYTLIDGTPNDGSAMVPVPNVTTSEARVMVKGRANVFFDVSDESFPIEMPSLPTFLLSADPTSQSVCSQSMATYLLHFQQVLGFNETVSLSVTGVPPGATAAFQPASVVPPGMVDLLISDLQNVPPGSYTLTVDAVAVSVSRSIEVELVVEQVLTAGPTLISPPDGATDVSPNGVVLQWESFTPTSTYNVQVSLSPDFQVLVHEGTATTNMLDLPPLSEIQVYYWRVEGQNACSQGPYSDPFAFQTGGLSCDTIESTNVPLDIPDDGSGPVVSTLQVNTGQPVSSIYLHTDITHTWVGDLTGSVESPNGTVATLFDRPGHPIVDDGCEGDNMSVGFSDTAPNTADDLESTCPLGDIPVIQGDFQPLQPFSVFNGENSMGEWKLRIEDMFPEFDQGTLQSWFMEICNTQPIPAAVLLNNSPLTVAEGGSAVIANSHLQTQGIPAQTTYLLLSPPTNGTLYLSGAALLIGSSFTQADIDNGSLSYTHDGSPTMADQFAFDVVDDGNHWLHNQLFQINILQNTLSATAALTQPIDCHNANNAIIAATATGGTPPLTYSLNGGTAQSSNVFDQLGAGTYEVTVMDANGFSVTTNAVDIANPPPITLTADVVNDDITANAGGGTGTLQYSIDGVNFQTSPLFENLPNGVYTVTAMDANGCTQDTTAIVAVNTLIVSASQTKAISCFGDSDGEITAQVAGGTPPYEYSIDGVNFQSANVFQNLASGTYTVTVRDADGFVQTDEITLSDPPLLQVSASANGYEVSVAASGGTGTLTYNLNGGAFQSDPQFFPVANGPHNVGVRDENGCEQSVSVEVNVPALGVAGMATQTPSCSDTSDGVITATGTGGVPPYEYSLNGGAFQSNNVFAGLAPGLYMLTIRDSGGFTASSAGITMAAPSPIVVNAQANLDVVTVNVTGGTSPYEYSLDGGPFQSSNIFTGVADGMHTVVVRDANGCEASTDVLVSLPPLNLTATMTQPILCHGDENGIIMLDAAGGVLPYEYSLNGTDFQSSNTFTGLPPGTYQPTVRDASGQVITAPDITLANPDPLQAEGSAFGPLITVEASGGTGSYTYSFDNMPFQNENEYEVLFNGVYPVVVMDENGCTTETEVEVNKPEMVFFTIINASCADSEDGEIIIEGVSGGYPPYLFMLENGPLLPDLHYTGLGTGEYIFLVVDSTGYEW